MACPHCDDTRWRPVERDGVRRVERCECWQDTQVTALFRESRIEARYSRCTLDGLIVYDNEKFKNAVAKARQFARDFPAVQKGLILTGPAGIGKTHIAAAVLRQLILDKRVRGLFYDVPTLLRLIRSTYNPVVRTAEMDILRPTMECELLVLDDLGKEKPSEWVEDTLNLIVGTRYNQKRLTIFTTNYEDGEDATVLDSLQARVGFRMWSRLHEMCEFLEFSGLDFRLLESGVGSEEMGKLWKGSAPRRGLPPRAAGPARAQLRPSAPDPQKSADHELKWPGGKGGR